MQKNSITNKITPCCGLPFSVIYWWVSNLTLNSESDRQFILSNISQNGKISIDGWKVLINSGVLESDASLTKAEFLAWFDCGRQPSCEQLKLIIESFKISNWIPEAVLNSDFGGKLSITDTPTPTKPTWYFASEVGIYTNLGGLNIEDYKFAIIIYDGENWSVVNVSLPNNFVQVETSQRIIDENLIPFAIIDENNNKAFAVNTDGTTDLIFSEKTKEQFESLESYYFAIVDDDDNKALSVNKDGTTDMKPSEKTLSFFSDISGIYKQLLNGNDLKYCEIGDSISTWDNKKEEGNAVDGQTGFGYGGYGYGRVICDALNISYDNHFPLGRNGRTITEFVSEGHINSIPNDCDIYTIFLGTNDWGKNYTNIGTMANYIDNDFDANVSAKNTSYGAYRKIIDKILNGRGMNTPIIILMTPMHRGLFGFASDLGTLALPDTQPNSKGYYLQDFANLIKEVAKYEGIPCLDLFDDGVVLRRFLNQDTTWNTSVDDRPKNYQDVFYDNLHPTDKGFKLIGVKLLFKIIERIPDLIGKKIFS